MTTLAFDTYAFIRKLKNSGFSESQAETLTDLHREAVAATLEQARHDFKHDELATKQDIKELESTTKQDIKELGLTTKQDIKELELKMEVLRAEVKRDVKDVELKVAETKSELIRWVVGVGILQTTLLTGVLLRMTKFL